MVMRERALRILLALFLVLSGVGAVTSDAAATLVEGAAAQGVAMASQDASAPHDQGAEKTASLQDAKRPCVSGECLDAADKDEHGCSTTVSHCMPIGVLMSSKAAAARVSVRADLSAAIDRLPYLSQWVLDPPPPRN